MNVSNTSSMTLQQIRVISSTDHAELPCSISSYLCVLITIVGMHFPLRGDIFMSILETIWSRREVISAGVMPGVSTMMCGGRPYVIPISIRLDIVSEG